MAETDLYPPIKRFLEGQGFEVKGEVGPADVVAQRGGDLVVVELKTGFSLTLLHQGVARQALTDLVYVAVPRQAGRRGWKALQANIGLARRLGLGVLTVRLKDGLVEAHADPGPYHPRKSPRKQGALLREFLKREGDPNQGGSTRVGLVTAYRQDAMKCRDHLARHGASKGAEVARATGVDRATRVMADNHYGWFERVERGIYALTAKGQGENTPK